MSRRPDVRSSDPNTFLPGRTAAVARNLDRSTWRPTGETLPQSKRPLDMPTSLRPARTRMAGLLEHNAFLIAARTDCIWNHRDKLILAGRTRPQCNSEVTVNRGRFRLNAQLELSPSGPRATGLELVPVAWAAPQAADGQGRPGKRKMNEEVDAETDCERTRSTRIARVYACPTPRWSRRREEATSVPHVPREKASTCAARTPCAQATT